MTQPPFLRVISGNPSEEEIATIIAVAQAAEKIRLVNEPTKLSTWGDPRSHMRHHLPVGPSAWRQSAWAKY
jgi:hypothetical protein